MSVCTFDRAVKARKPHECRVCGETINPGETCQRRAGFDSEGPGTIHMHLECLALTHDWSYDDWEVMLPGDEKRPKPPVPANPRPLFPGAP